MVRPRRARRLGLAAVLCVVCCTAGSVTVAAAPEEGVRPDRAALSEMFEQGGLQRTLPGAEPSYDGESSGAARRGSSRIGGSVARGAATSLAVAGTVLFWTLLTAAVAVLLVWIVRQRRPRAGPPRAGPPVSRRGAGAAAVDHGGRVPGLIEHGAYLEAVHELLLDGLAKAFNVEETTGLPRASTSRELLHTLAAESPARTPLTTLVSIVEEGLFAARPLTLEHVERARRAHAELVDSREHPVGTGRA